MHVDLDTLATALYVKIDDELKASPQPARRRPRVGIAPRLSDAELVTVAVVQALLGFHDEARWLRWARTGIKHLFPYLPSARTGSAASDPERYRRGLKILWADRQPRRRILASWSAAIGQAGARPTDDREIR